MQVVKCFPGGKFKALTLSYDDGRTADRRLVEIFNKYGIKGTFHLNSGLIGVGDRVEADEVKSLYEGHEVAAHTVTHPTIARCPKEQVVQELLMDRMRLEELVGYPVRGLSYPNGSHSKQIRELLPHLGYAYSRVVGDSHSFGLPEDLYQWKSTCHHRRRLLEHGETFINLHKRQYLYLMYVWGHSYEFDNDQNWDLIEDFCKLVGGRDDIWYATNIEIVDYLHAFDQLQFAASMKFVYNPTALSVWISVGGEIVEVKSGEQVQLA
ncbi:MAG: polysaccharide deacetylase family protein [Candidatus Wallacebacter cryptica]|jgi:peptidoglycan/xylan/chitin deacetylase (PgdA/CDA1 family)|nr:polysaccharide deacetylase family protein [Bacillota bacterium]